MSGPSQTSSFNRAVELAGGKVTEEEVKEEGGMSMIYVIEVLVPLLIAMVVIWVFWMRHVLKLIG